MTDYERKDLEIKKKICIYLNRIANSLEKGVIDVKVAERAIGLNDLNDLGKITHTVEAVEC